ncbi:AAA family ATPase [Halobaculum sp. MBLA0147]|uniref:AAA family ATPase n=1 Tax=Halobaculum sp. MBLA0147 TaxID=3079934 RepID=UPI003525E7B8
MADTDPDTTDETDETGGQTATDTADEADEADGRTAADTSDTTADPFAETDVLLVGSVDGSGGKTAVALALATLAQERGLDVGYAKPKGTRLRSRVGKVRDEDPMLARELLGTDDELHEMEPVVYSPTFVEGAIRGMEDPDDLRAQVRDSLADVAADRDLLVVEGGDSLATGGVVELTDPDVAALLDARILLVADHDEPGDADDVLAAAAQAGDRLAGVLFNRIADADYDDVARDVAPFLEGRGVPSLGVVPRRSELAGVAVGALADELGADVLTDAPDDTLVEGFLVGAMSGDAALRHMRRRSDVAVITGGDRSDVLTAGIDAGVACLVLTGGHRPSGAVLGKAEAAGVPVLSVNTDTLTAVERAEEIVNDGRTRDERTVAIMRELLRDHADVDEILDGV